MSIQELPYVGLKMNKPVYKTKIYSITKSTNNSENPFYHFNFVNINDRAVFFNFAFSRSQDNGIIFLKEKYHKMANAIPFSYEKKVNFL